MNQKSFLPVWEKVREKCKDSYEWFADGIFVESVIVEPPEKAITRADGSSVSLVMAGGEKKSRDGLDLAKAHFVRVLDIGKGFYDDETGEDVPLSVKPGDICLVEGPTSVKWWSTIFGLVNSGDHRIGLIKEDQILLRFPGQEAFDEFNRTVSEAIG